MYNLEQNKLTRAEELFDAGELDEALELLNDLDQYEELNREEKEFYQFLKGLILAHQNKFKETIKLGEQMFKEGQEFGENLQAFDGLYLNIIGLILGYEFEESIEIIKQAEKILEQLTDIPQKDLVLREVRINVTKSWVYYHIGNVELAEKNLKLALESEKELGATFEIIWAYLVKAQIALNVNLRLDLAMEYAKKSMSLAEEIKFNHYWIATIHIFFGVIYSGIGEFDLSLNHSMKALNLFKKLNNKKFIAGLLNNIGTINGIIGNYDIALEYLEDSLERCEKLSTDIEACLDNLIFVAYELGNKELAEKYFIQLENLYKKNKKNKRITLIYKYNQALMLKRSSRIRDKVKAEELLKEVVETEIFSFELTLSVYNHLCDLLLLEFRINNNAEVLDEINQYIAKLLSIAESSHSYLVFCETFILQAKLALLNLDIKGARRFLTQAQKIAEKYGIIRLAMKISHEHDELLKQLNLWEKLEDSEASLSERWELAGLNEQMQNMVKKSLVKIPKLEAEQPVLLCIMTKAGNVLLSNPFTADLSIDSAYFGDFLSSCNTFCDQIFSETFDRVKFGQNTVLITSVNSFSICYMFQGQSYSARQKLLHFSEAIKKETGIMTILQEVSNKKVEIKVSESTILE
ncbi:MAG: tetratricopeptide repeat protein, partial [Candidatus Hodarchaeota archaeon]